jgi:hypothetical protein
MVEEVSVDLNEAVERLKLLSKDALLEGTIEGEAIDVVIAELEGRTDPATVRVAVEAERNRLIRAAIVKDFGSNPYYVGLGRNSIVNIPTEQQAIAEVRRILGLK